MDQNKEQRRIVFRLQHIEKGFVIDLRIENGKRLIARNAATIDENAF
jgi:hypothetical protein